MRRNHMARWEYLILDLANLPARTDDVDLLNDAGEQGWELIAIMSNPCRLLAAAVDNPTDAPADRPSRRRQGVG